MPTPVGFADVSILITLTGDPDPFAITYGIETDMAGFDGLAHANKQFAAFTGAWAAFLTDEGEVTAAVVRIGQDAGDDLIFTSDITAVPGTNAGNVLPQNCALLVKKNTALGGRRNRGRCYIPSVLDELIVNPVGEILEAQVANLQLRAEDWMDNLTGTNGGIEPATPMVILHRDTVAPIAPTPVTTLTVDPRIATQRRRLRR